MRKCTINVDDNCGSLTQFKCRFNITMWCWKYWFKVKTIQQDQIIFVLSFNHFTSNLPFPFAVTFNCNFDGNVKDLVGYFRGVFYDIDNFGNIFGFQISSIINDIVAIVDERFDTVQNLFGNDRFEFWVNCSPILPSVAVIVS